MNTKPIYPSLFNTKSILSLCSQWCASVLVLSLLLGLGHFEFTQHFCASKLMEQSFASQKIQNCCSQSSSPSEIEFQKANCCSIQTQVLELPQASMVALSVVDLEKAPVLKELSFRLLASDLKNHNRDIFKIPLQVARAPSWIVWGAFLS